MKVKNTKSMRLANRSQRFCWPVLLCASLPSAQAQFFGGFGGATTLTGASTLAGAADSGRPCELWRSQYSGYGQHAGGRHRSGSW